MTSPFTREEAEDICEDFQDLPGTKIMVSPTQTLYIESVLVSPFDEQSKETFAEDYHKSRDGVSALETYSGVDFDVIVFMHDTEDKEQFNCIPIRAFATTRGIFYRFPERDWF